MLYNNKLYKSGVLEDFILCAGASYFAASFNTDTYVSGKIFTLGKFLAFGLMILCWLIMSFTNGLKMRKGFIVCAMCWNGLLPAAAIVIKSVRALKFSQAGMFIKELSMILTEFPYQIISGRFNMDITYYTLIMAVMCLLFFVTGYIIALKSHTRYTEDNG